MSSSTFNEIRAKARLLLHDEDFSGLRDVLKVAAKHGWIEGSFTSKGMPINTKVGRENLKLKAQEFIKQATITPTGLNEFGWTATLIKKYLGNPDAIAENPHYKRGAPMQLYSRNRVDKISLDPDVATALEAVLSKRGKRKEAAAKGVKTKIEKLRNWLDSVEIEIPDIPIAELLSKSINHYNSRNRNSQNGATVYDDVMFLERITKNYVRHCETDYESTLNEMAGNTGITELYPILKSRINFAVDIKYGDLRETIEKYQAAKKQQYEEDKKAKKQRRIKAQQERERLLQEEPKEYLIIWLSKRLGGIRSYPAEDKHQKCQKYANRAAKLIHQFSEQIEKTPLAIDIPSCDKADLRPKHFEDIIEALKIIDD